MSRRPRWSRKGLWVPVWSCSARTGIMVVSVACSCCIFFSTATARGNLMTLSRGKGASMWTPAQRPSSVSRATPARAFLSRIRVWMSRSRERASTVACGVAGNPSAAWRGMAGESSARESKRAGKMRDMESSQGCGVLWRYPKIRAGLVICFREDRDWLRQGQEENVPRTGAYCTGTESGVQRGCASQGFHGSAQRRATMIARYRRQVRIGGWTASGRRTRLLNAAAGKDRLSWQKIS